MNASQLTPDQPAAEESRARLEKVFIQAYLRTKGYTMESLHRLPEEEAKRLMIEASIYASTKLAEVETRTQLLDELHGTSQV